MLTLGILRVERKRRSDVGPVMNEINMVESSAGSASSGMSNQGQSQESSSMPASYSPTMMIIQTPSQLPVTNTHAIPWTYGLNVVTQAMANPIIPPKSTPVCSVMHIPTSYPMLPLSDVNPLPLSAPPIQVVMKIPAITQPHIAPTLSYPPSGEPTIPINTIPNPVNYAQTLSTPTLTLDPNTEPIPTPLPSPISSSSPLKTPGPKDADSIVNLAGIGGMTRSGRCYLSEEVERQRKGKAKEGEIIQQKGFEGDNTQRVERPANDDEIVEFLKFMKNSEYSVVEQLKKTPARISLMSLIMNSEPHRKALLKVLNEAYVPPDVTVEKVTHLVNQIQATNFITFTDDEIGPSGRGHTKALHIVVHCKGHTIARVLLDGGSALNVLPYSTFKQLQLDPSLLRPNCMLVKAFDGIKREVIGDIDVEVSIGIHVFNVAFQVMDIDPSYTILLGRPWIHTAGAVPSTLHQRVKYVIDDHVVTILAEDTLLISKHVSVPYIESTNDSLENSFRAFEIVSVTYVGENSVVTWPRLSRAMEMTAKIMLLGRNIVSRVWKAKLTDESKSQRADFRFGLGYKPKRSDYLKFLQEKREKKLALLEGREPNDPQISFPLFKSIFPRPVCIMQPAVNSEEALAESLSELSVNALEVAPIRSPFIWPTPADEVLNNWKMDPIFRVFKFK